MHNDQRFTNISHWQNPYNVLAASYRCGYCSSDVGSAMGLATEGNLAFVRICPQCNGPTFFAVDGGQWPGPKVGTTVTHLPSDVQSLYEEARSSIAGNAFTGSVMLCRKILMHIAVEKGAKDNLSFQKYVQWLIEQRYAPRGAEVWVDYIRDRGNDANHEIIVMTKDDATGVLRFTEALLRNVYELASLVPEVAIPIEDVPPTGDSDNNQVT
jgi:hypothetical protein